jgi:hypothetical protein
MFHPSRILSEKNWRHHYKNTAKRHLVLRKNTLKSQANNFLRRDDRHGPGLSTVCVTRFLEGFADGGLKGTYESYTLEDGQKIVLVIGQDKTCAIGRVNSEPHTPLKYFAQTTQVKSKYFKQTITFSPFVFSLRKNINYEMNGHKILKMEELGVTLGTVTFLDIDVQDLIADMKDALNLIDIVGPFVNLTDCDEYPDHPIAPWEDTDQLDEEFQNIITTLITGRFYALEKPLKKLSIEGRVINEDGTFGPLKVDVREHGYTILDTALNDTVTQWLNSITSLKDFPVPHHRQASFSTKPDYKTSKIEKSSNMVYFGTPESSPSGHSKLKAIQTYHYWNEILKNAS